MRRGPLQLHASLFKIATIPSPKIKKKSLFPELRAIPLGSVLPPYKTSRNSGREPISLRLHTLMFTPGSGPTTWAQRSSSISAVGGLSTWFNGKSRAATEGVKTTICLRYAVAVRAAGTWKLWPLSRNLSPPNFIPTFLPASLFLFLFALFSLLLLVHIRGYTYPSTSTSNGSAAAVIGSCVLAAAPWEIF